MVLRLYVTHADVSTYLAYATDFFSFSWYSSNAFVFDLVRWAKREKKRHDS